MKCEDGNREERMVVIEKHMDGTPKVWCDPCIVDLVKALNDAGLETIASCCGHGRPLGIISLKDGRHLIICHDYDQAMAKVNWNHMSYVTPQPCRCKPEQSNVVQLGLETVQDIPAGRVTGSAAKADLTQAVVIGTEPNGTFYFASSQGSDAETNYLLQKGIQYLHQDRN